MRISAPISIIMSHSRKSDFLFWRISWRKRILCCNEKNVKQQPNQLKDRFATYQIKQITWTPPLVSYNYGYFPVISKFKHSLPLSPGTGDWVLPETKWKIVIEKTVVTTQTRETATAVLNKKEALIIMATKRGGPGIFTLTI